MTTDVNPQLKMQGRILSNEKLFAYSYVGLGGNARWMAFPHSKEDVALLMEWCSEQGVPCFVLGNASNTLISDAGFPGLVISLKEMSTEILFRDDLVEVRGEIRLDKLVNKMYQKGLGGLEHFVGVPGLLMASLFNNAGAAGKGLCERLHSLTYVDLKGQMQEIVSGEFDFSYRRGPLKEGVIVGAKLKATQRNKKDIRNKIREHIQYRKKTQPLKSQSLGCVFKNPKSGFASQWIDKSGLKGRFLGDIEVSERHANFFLNHGQGTAKDYWALIQEVKEAVVKAHGIELNLEIQLLGEFE